MIGHGMKYKNATSPKMTHFVLAKNRNGMHNTR